MEEWKEYKLADVCDLIPGFAFKSADFGDYDTKAIKIKDIQPPFVNTDGADGVNIAKYDVNKLSKFIVKRGDFILAMTGATIGKIGRYIDETPAYLNQRVLRFSPKDIVDFDFIYYYLSTKNFQSYIINHVDSESAQPNISGNTIGKYPIFIPSIVIQKRITKVLKSLDDKIEINRRINENLEQQAQALFKSWFVDFEPFRDKPFVESELGMIPEGWRVICLGEVCKCVLGGTPSRSHDEYWNGDIPWINSGEVNNFRILSPTEYITKEGLEKSATKLLPAHTTVLAITGATLGQVSLLEMESCANQSVIGVLDNPNIPYSFIYPLINFKIKELMSHMTGGAQQHINKDNVEQLKIVLPPQYILKKYACLSVPLFEKISNSCFQSANLAKTRDTLLPRLMSGELKVQEIEESL